MKLPTLEKQFLARAIRDRDGVEVTPDQAEQQLTEALGVIRRDLVAGGYPEFADVSDAELRDMVRDALD